LVLFAARGASRLERFEQVSRVPTCGLSSCFYAKFGSVGVRPSAKRRTMAIVLGAIPAAVAREIVLELNIEEPGACSGRPSDRAPRRHGCPGVLSSPTWLLRRQGRRCWITNSSRLRSSQSSSGKREGHTRCYLCHKVAGGYDVSPAGGKSTSGWPGRRQRMEPGGWT